MRLPLAIEERALGPEHPDTANSLNNRALVLRDQGDLASARPLFERALAIWETTLGAKHPKTSRGGHDLARLRLADGAYAEALLLAEAALVARDNALGAAHPWTRDPVRVTADALDALGDGA